MAAFTFTNAETIRRLRSVLADAIGLNTAAGEHDDGINRRIRLAERAGATYDKQQTEEGGQA